MVVYASGSKQTVCKTVVSDFLGSNPSATTKLPLTAPALACGWEHQRGIRRPLEGVLTWSAYVEASILMQGDLTNLLL